MFASVLAQLEELVNPTAPPPPESPQEATARQAAQETALAQQRPEQQAAKWRETLCAERAADALFRELVRRATAD